MIRNDEQNFLMSQLTTTRPPLHAAHLPLSSRSDYYDPTDTTPRARIQSPEMNGPVDRTKDLLSVGFHAIPASRFSSFLSNQFSSILTSRRQLVQRNQSHIPQHSLSHPPNGIKNLTAVESIEDPKFPLRVSIRNPRVHMYI